jgi:hypothetical protein
LSVDTGIHGKAFIACRSPHVAGKDTALRVVIATDRKIGILVAIRCRRPEDPFGGDQLAILSFAWQRATKRKYQGRAHHLPSMPG